MLGGAMKTMKAMKSKGGAAGVSMKALIATDKEKATSSAASKKLLKTKNQGHVR